MDTIYELLNDPNFTSIAIPALVITPFIIIALVFVVMALRAGGKVRASKNWPATQGRVLMSYVDRRRSRSGSGTTTAFYPVVVYEYMVNGRRLQGNRVRFGADWGTSWTGPAQKIVDQYPTGALIEVFYDPERPEEAVLLRTASTSNRIFGCVAVFIIVTVLFSFAMSAGAFGFAQQFIDGLGLGGLLGGTTKK
ncbi:MAG: DUF3592 domain-containing protein [Chloroflexi bacterium]|nr:DUF3592 domain-containing protein [Chloroflexota bacterium]